jgi:hypothetical protein
MSRLAGAIIGNAIIWGAIIIGSALVLKGTEQSEQIRLMLIAGAGVSTILLGGLLGKKR